MEGSRNVHAILQDLEAMRIGKFQLLVAFARSISPANVFTLLDFRDPNPLMMHLIIRVLALSKAIRNRALKRLRSIIAAAA